MVQITSFLLQYDSNADAICTWSNIRSKILKHKLIHHALILIWILNSWEDLNSQYYALMHSTETCLRLGLPNTLSSFSNLLTPWSRVLLEKLTGSAASQEIPGIFGTQRFITVLTSARHLSLSWASSIQSSQPPPTSWRSILILSSHLRLGLPSGHFPSGFPTRTLCTPLPSPIRATCPAHLMFLNFTTRTIFSKEYRSLSSSLCNFLHSRYLVSLRPKYSPQHPILKHPQPTFLPQR